MKHRRQVLAGLVGASTLALGGCQDVSVLGDDGDPDPLERWIPAASETDEYESNLDQLGYDVYSVDVTNVRNRLETMSSDADDTVGAEIPVLQTIDHESLGIEYAAVDRMLIAGSGINAFPVGGVDPLGRFTQTVTIGEFDRGDVVNAVETADANSRNRWFLENAERNDRGDFAVFSADGFSVGVVDGAIVAGFDDVVRASIDCYEGDAESYLNDDSLASDLVNDLNDRSFFAVRRHDPREQTDVENGVFEGEVAVGDGHTVADDGIETRIVRVFEEEDAVDEDAVEAWADDVLESLLDTEVRVDDRRVVIEGRVETDAIPSGLAGFTPFGYAYLGH